MRKRILTLILCLVLCMSMPLQAFAEENDIPVPEEAAMDDEVTEETAAEESEESVIPEESAASEEVEEVAADESEETASDESEEESLSDYADEESTPEEAAEEIQPEESAEETQTEESEEVNPPEESTEETQPEESTEEIQPEEPDEETSEAEAEESEIAEIVPVDISAVIDSEPAAPDAVIPGADAGILDNIASGTCGDNLSWYVNSYGELWISGSGDMTEYSSSAETPWRDICTQIKKLCFSSSCTITSISDYAFSGCIYLELYYDITLPTTLKRIGKSAFNSCNALTYVCIPKSVTEIGSTAFGYCSSLKNVTICGAPSISSHVFYDCSALTEISFLGDAPSFTAQSFNAITLKAWYPTDNSSWTSDVRQDYSGTVTWASGYHGWCGDNIIWNLYAGSGELELSGSGATWFSVSPLRHSYYTLASKIESITVGEGITELRQGALGNLTNTTSITLPSTLESIGNNVFYGSAITTIKIPKNVNSLEAAFNGCSKLTEVHFLGHAPSTIQDNAFKNITANVYYYPVPSWTEDKKQQYSGTLTWVKNDKIGDKVTWRMTNYPKEGAVYISGTGETWDWPSDYPGFYNFRDEIKLVSVGSGVTALGTYLFYSLPQLKEAVIPETVTELRNNAFTACWNLNTIRFAGNAPTFASNVFTNVTATAYYLPIENGGWTSSVMQNYGGSITWVCDNQVGDNVTWTLSSDGKLTLTGSGATWSYSYNDQHPGFYYSQMSVKSISVDAGVTSLGDYLFYRMQRATSCTLPNSLMTIGRYAFRECYNLSSFKFPDYLTEIGQDAFLGCYDLPSLEIPATVTTIGSYAFDDCTSMTEVRFLGHAPKNMGNDIFRGDTATVYYYPVYSWKKIKDNLQQFGDNVDWVCDDLIGGNISWNLSEGGYMIFYGTDATWDFLEDYPGFHNFKDEIVFAEMSSDITYLGQFLFFNMSALECVIIDTGVTEIGNFCFAGGCLNLKEIYFAYKAPTFGVNPFVNVEATAYYLPIEDSGWTEDVMLDYGGTINWVCNDHVGDNVTWSLNSQGLVILTGSGPTWNHDSYKTEMPGYYLCADHVKNVNVSSGITTLGDYLFNSLYKLESVGLPNTIESIGIQTFAYSTLKSVVIPHNVTEIGMSAFAWCNQLNEILFKGHAPEFDSYVFNNVNATAYYYPVYTWTSDKLQQYYGTITWVKDEMCGDDVTWKLESDGILTLSGTGETWEYGATPQDFLYFSDEIMSAVVSEGVTQLSTEVFCDLDQIKDVTLPSTLKTIGIGAFSNTGLSSVSIPAGVTKIEKRAFGGCGSLKEINFFGQAPTFADNVFNGVTATAYYPAGDTTWTTDKRQNYGGTITWVAYGELDVKFTHSCSFENNITLNYYIPAAALEGYENYRLEIKKQVFNSNGSSYTWNSYEITTYTNRTNGGTAYIGFSFSNIAAKEMGDDLHAVLYADKNGTTYKSAVDKYSVRQYAYNRLEKSTDAYFKTLLVDMLNYGAAAQVYFSYNTKHPANAELTAEQQAIGTTTMPELVSIENLIPTEGATAKFPGKAIVLGSNVEIKYYMTFDTGAPKNSVKLVLSYMTINGVEHTVTIPASEFIYSSSHEAYSGKLTTIAAKDMSCKVTAKIYDGDTLISDILEYSIETYAYNRLLKSTDENFKDLVRNMMKYGKSAEAYFRNKNN